METLTGFRAGLLASQAIAARSSRHLGFSLAKPAKNRSNSCSVYSARTYRYPRLLLSRRKLCNSPAMGLWNVRVIVAPAILLPRTALGAQRGRTQKWKRRRTVTQYLADYFQICAGINLSARVAVPTMPHAA